MKRFISDEEKAQWNSCAIMMGIDYKIKEISSESRGGYIYNDESASAIKIDSTKKIEGRFIELYCK